MRNQTTNLPITWFFDNGGQFFEYLNLVPQALLLRIATSPSEHTNNAQSYNEPKRKDQLCSMYLGVNYVSEISRIDWDSLGPGILEGDDYQLNYQTTLTKSHQEKSDPHIWILWEQMLKMFTPSPKAKTNKLQQQLRPWIETHSECGK